MRTSECIACSAFPCTDVKHERYVIPDAEIDAASMRIVLISESAPEKPSDYYYAGGESLFEHTTLQAFRDAGADVSSILDITRLGVYMTSAVKCGKTGYNVEHDRPVLAPP
jgi:hypothetical protein